MSRFFLAALIMTVFEVLPLNAECRCTSVGGCTNRRFFHPTGDSDGVTAWINDFGCRLVINCDHQNVTGSSPHR